MLGELESGEGEDFLGLGRPGGPEGFGAMPGAGARQANSGKGCTQEMESGKGWGGGESVRVAGDGRGKRSRSAGVSELKIASEYP